MRIEHLFKTKQHILSIFFTAGFPSLGDTARIIKALDKAGADLIEIGIPFSDPLADGEIIQQSSQVALKNGMNLPLLFEHLKEIRLHTEIPLILMGYLNPILKFGIENFCKQSAGCGIDGFIIPDLPLRAYVNDWKNIVNSYGLKQIFMITPDTSVERLHGIDAISGGFIYLVTSSSTTGNNKQLDPAFIEYTGTIKSAGLKNPVIAGFGISTREDLNEIYKHVDGAVIGSRFIKVLGKAGQNIEDNITSFISSLRG